MNNHLRHAPSRLLILAAIVLFPLFSCSTSMRSQSDDVLSTEIETRPERQVLSQSGAIRRAKQVGDVHYDLYFEIGREDEFRSTTTLAFDLQDASDPLEIDFHKGNIQNLVVNGKEVPAPNYNGFYLTLANENLVVGANEVTIEFTRPYSNTGFGFYRFKDPEDGKFYLFTDFEPFSANSLFPCFDQPDLKATYRLRVLAPEGWFVISSVLERSTSKEGEKVLWDFPTSKKFSTYLFPLHAGPY